MMISLYVEGEVVILKHTGQHCTVLEVTYEEAVEITGRGGRHSTFCYKVGVVGPNGNDKWVENALLPKKHEPSEFSFSNLMDSLKNPVLEWK